MFADCVSMHNPATLLKDSERLCVGLAESLSVNRASLHLNSTVMLRISLLQIPLNLGLLLSLGVQSKEGREWKD